MIRGSDLRTKQAYPPRRRAGHAATLAIVPLLLCALAMACQAAPYGTARYATPVLNSPDFGTVFGGADGISLKTDRCGQVAELEYIALPGTLFRIQDEIRRDGTTIYRVETDEYPAPAGTRLYVDSRFLDAASAPHPPRQRTLPPRERITELLRKAAGSPYVWGGNIPEGVPELLQWYYAGKPQGDRRRAALAGIDCSGLLYHATSGWTPRNTSDLLKFGRALSIEGKKAEEIAGLLEPLDLIVWKGHVLIVLDRQTIIESRLECGKPGSGGVVTTPLLQRVQQIMRTRKPHNEWPGSGKKNSAFVVRRWVNTGDTADEAGGAGLTRPN